MYRTILLPIDLNHEASWQQALPVASKLAQSGGGALHLLAIAPDYGLSMVSSYFPEDFERSVLQRMEAELHAFVAKHIPDLPTDRVHLAHGHIASVILETAEAIGADLIVMASHQPDELRDFIVGSKADRVVHRSPVSVLVVRG